MRPSARMTPERSCADCEHLPPTFGRAVSVFPYQGPAGEIVRNLKYHRAPYLAEWLVALCHEAAPEVLEALKPISLIVPVPMTPARRRQRGYNQADLLAAALPVRGVGGQLARDVVRRCEQRGPQARHHTREDRLTNMEGAFEVLDPLAIEGADILVVDDVMTSGATVGSLAGVLLEAGAGRVEVFTVLRARLGVSELKGEV